MSIDREIFASDVVRVGLFRCEPDEADFADSGPTTTFCFVFPREAVRIEHEGCRSFVADPNTVVLYNRRQPYRRGAVANRGDRSEWFAVHEDILRDVLRAFDADAAGQLERPFRFSRVASDARMYLLQRKIFSSVCGEQPVDRLAVETSVIGLLEAVLASAYRAKPRIAGAARSTAAERAQELLNQRFAENLTLRDIASATGCSPYHLCHSFHSHFGMPPHRYRDQLRLRAALERVPDAQDLTRLALDLGFSSHSHFTARFRASFGATPSQIRAATCDHHTETRRSGGRYIPSSGVTPNAW